MENKYYDLITTLVKQHKKYVGLEVLLNDIVKDVYEHSKTVLESVKDDDVIRGYLNKIIGISILTIPRKFNFNKNVQHANIQPASITTPRTNNISQEKHEVNNSNFSWKND